MTYHLFPVLFGLVVWWASTVLIVYLDGLPRKTFKWSLVGATAVLAASLWGLWASARSPTVGGAYAAFACGVFAWGWQEISFYMGAARGSSRARKAAAAGPTSATRSRPACGTSWPSSHRPQPSWR